MVEDEGKGEEPEVCAKEQMEFDWAQTWLGGGRMPGLADGQAQGLICQVFFLLFPALSLSYLILVPGSHHPAPCLGCNGYQVFCHFVFQGVSLLHWANAIK